MNKIVVVGSANTDFVFKTKKFPVAGETVLGTDFSTTFGGKGANQAVAAQLLGANVTFIAALGDDKIGKDTREHLEKLGISTEYIFTKEGCASGTACILVNEMSGENEIVVAPGANSALCPDDMALAAPAFVDAKMVVLQAEIPIETINWVVKYSRQLNIPVLFNPAPMPSEGFSEELLRDVSIFTPNETEMAILFPEEEDLDSAARKLLDIGIDTVIVTRGEKGANLYMRNGRLSLPAHEVTAVDTVGAGDTFSAAIAVAMVEGKNMQSAIEFAIVAAALSTTKHGAQSSMPSRTELSSILGGDRS